MTVPSLPLAAVTEGLSALPPTAVALLVLAVGLALAFEFVNGFHDTANAVATVIYTHALRPWVAVVWSGLCNLAGVLCSNGLVAYTILALLPAELVLHVGSRAGFAMIFALLTAAILWNLGTWYLGLPASSTHTLFGSILGVGLANALMSGRPWTQGVNWHVVRNVSLSLVVSPVIGFAAAGLLLWVLKRFVKSPALFQPPPKDVPPPWWIRGILIGTCTGVSFFHGTNDGQKGMGLLLLILIAIVPAEYALNLHAAAADLRQLERTSAMVQPTLDARAAAAAADPAARAAVATEQPPAAGKVAAALAKGASHDAAATTPQSAELTQYLQTGGKLTADTFAAVAATNRDLVGLTRGKDSLRDVPVADRQRLRADLYLVDASLAKLVATGQITGSAADARARRPSADSWAAAASWTARRRTTRRSPPRWPTTAGRCCSARSPPPGRPPGPPSSPDRRTPASSATTAHDLQRMVDDGAFDDRLLARVSVAVIDVPPLRDRAEDLPDLCRHFVATAARRERRPAMEPERAALDALQVHTWPRNVRELQNLVDRAYTVGGPGNPLRVGLIDPWLRAVAVDPVAASVEALAGQPLADIEKRVILTTLQQFRGHRLKTAGALGIGVRTLGIKLKRVAVRGRTRRARHPRRGLTGGPGGTRRCII